MDTLDYQRQYENIKKSALEATEKMFPIDGKDKLLRATKVWVDDDLDPTDYAGQKDAKLKDKTWGANVRGDFELVDKVTGKVVEREKGVRLFMLPKATTRMSFIVGGNEYQVDNQLRRKPGIYTIQSQGGDHDLRTEFNVAGQKLDLVAAPKTGVIRMKSRQGEGIPIYPILSHLGISDSAMAKAWGEDVLAANKSFRADRHEQYVRQAAKNMSRTGVMPGSATEAAEVIRQKLHDMEVDPKVNAKTIGDDSPRVTPHTLLAAAKSLIDVQFKPELGKLPIERDSLQYKRLMSVEDFVKERLEQKLPEAKRKFQNKLNLRKDQKIRDVVDLSVLNPTVETFFTQTNLSHGGEQTNPLQVINAITRVTMQGEGGAKASFTITPEARALHPTHLGFIDPVHTPESESIGSTLHLSLGARKRGNDVTTPVIDVKTGKHVEVTPQEMSDAVVSFPDQYDAKTGKFKEKEVKVLRGGKHSLVAPSEVQYVLSDPKQAFSVSTNLVPFLHSNSGGRALMAAKMLEQAIPLVEREAPLVQNKIRGTTFEKVIGGGFSHRSPVAGTVKTVGKSIVVTDAAGKPHEVHIYDNFPLNGKAFIHSEAVVKVGDKVAKGQVVADTNYTRGGTLAIGTNLRTVYTPYLGKNFEDGVAISESAAKKLSSEHLYPKYFRRQENVFFDRDKYSSLFPNVFSNEQLGKLDDDGVVRKGQVIDPGDPILAAVRHVEVTAADMARGKASAKALRPERSAEETWNGQTQAKVVDVVKGADGVKVFLKTIEPAQVGDKVTGRYGNKGIIVSIVPDAEAPRIGGVNGQPADVILNPTGIITRMNVGQMLETAASKVAEKTGKTYESDNFGGGDATKMVREDLLKHGLTDTEELYDPATNKVLGRVLSGKQYMLKLSKQAGTQFSARSWGEHSSGYDLNRAPIHGGEAGSKALDLLTLYAMLAHGSRANLKEMAVIKSQQNDEFWRAYESGRALPPPKPTFAYNKFLAYLKGAGVNVEAHGTKQVLVPMTDREVEHLSSGAVTEPLFVRRKDLAPEAGGFFDPAVTGGLPDRSGEGGEKWSHIELAEPVPNPIMEGPIRALLGLDKAKFNALVAGKQFWSEKDGLEAKTGLTGGSAIKAMLSKLDVDQMLKDANETAKTTKSQAKLDVAHKTIRYLRAVKESGRRPEELYVQSKIPVIPPVFRPLTPLPSGDITVEGPNRLYQHVAMLSNELKWQNSVPYITDSVKADLRGDLYESVSALAGLTAPLGFFPDKRKPAGFIELIKGKGQSKEGYYQHEVLRRKQDLVGRGTIIPEPKLGSDEVSIPQEMAWSIFKPFVIRSLVSSRGYTPADAQTAWTDRAPVARSVLEQVMDERPVMLNRAPSLHKFSIMAFKARMHDDPTTKSIKIPPLIVKGFNADFDGDTMAVHVPVLDAAVEEAKRMYPSRNIYNPGTGSLMLEPRQESMLGLNLLSLNPTEKKPKAELKDVGEVEIGINRGVLKYNDPVVVAGELTTAGRAMINQHLPATVPRLDFELNKDTAGKLYKDIAAKEKDNYANIVDRLRQLGDLHAFRSGFTVSLEDAQPDLPEKDQIFREAHAQVAAFRRTGAKQDLVDENVKKVFLGAEKKVQEVLNNRLKQQGNRFYTMVTTGARGNMSQLKQIVSAPVLVRDHRNDTIPTPVTTSFSKGMPLSDYWVTLYGARAGAMDRQLQTSKPGAFTKDIMAAAVSNLISNDDCGDNRGLSFDIRDKEDLREVNDRFLAQDVTKDGKVLVKRNTVITPKVTADLAKNGISTIQVRSPLTCLSPHGICALDYGLHDDGTKPQVGDNIGAISGQAMSEPLTQLTMSTFHSGSVAGAGLKLSTFDKIDKLMRLQKRLPGKATLADVSGRVDKIEPSGVKSGSNVTIAGVEHFVPKSHPLLVREGSNVRAGDTLSEGIISPQELLEKKKELLPALEYMAKEVTNAYRSEKVPLRQRAVETVVRTLGSLTRVVDPGSSGYAAGELAPYQVVANYNQTALGSKPIGEALDSVLAEDGGPIKAGTKVDKRVQKILGDLGIKSVKLGPDPIIHEPQIYGVKRLPLMRSDWMSQLGYNHIKDALLEGAANRSESDVHGFHPIPAFAYGAEFGEGQEGAY